MVDIKEAQHRALMRAQIERQNIFIVRHIHCRDGYILKRKSELNDNHIPLFRVATNGVIDEIQPSISQKFAFVFTA